MTSVEPAGDAPATAAGAATSRTLAPLLERLEHMVHPARLSLARAFALAMLRRVPDEQLEATDPETLASEVAAAFQFVDERSPGQLALRTLDAPVSIDGWSDPGTVVEVCVDDRPFLLSSLNEELRRLGHQIVRTFHPIFGVERDDAGRLTAIVPARGARQRDAFLHVELDRRLPEDEHESLQRCLRVVLEDVLGATRDYPTMRTRLLELAQAMRAGHAPEHLEVAQLIEWLLADNFVLLGCRDYDLVALPDGRPAIAAQAGSGLGTLADTSDSHYSEPVALDDADEGFRRRHTAPDVLTVARSHRFSTVHRRARMLNIWVKRLDDSGQVAGEFRLIGLFSRKAFAETSTTVPVLRRKLAHVLDREDIVQGSHDERTFVSLFEALPKDELFEADLDTLHATLLQLFEAEERREVRLQVRVDTFTRTASALVALPRDRYDVHLRKRLQALFLEAFGGESVDVDLSLGNRPDAIVRFAVHLREGARPTVAFDELEAEVRALCRTWEDDVRDALVAAHGEAGGQHLTRDYAQRLSQAYRDRTPPATTVRDIEVLDELVRSSDELTVELAADTLTDRPLTRVKVFKVGAGIELSRILPLLESLGLTVVEELPFRLVGDDPELHIHDYGVHLDGLPLDEARHVERVRAAILAAWRGALEIDSLNRLVLRADLDWADVALLRAYRRYRNQVGTVFTGDYENDALVANPALPRALVELFAVRFDPARDSDDGEVAERRKQVLAEIDALQLLDHDRIARGYLALIDATVRTNRYVVDERTPLALKLTSALVPQLPKPIPYREIFVYSPEVEGVHLRAGPVARGGLRWSDRRDDVRTEVLGLMQAQVLKNSVIVPTGAKGGFVVKRPPADVKEMPEAVRRQYEAFVRALLQVTDNIVGGEVSPPPKVRRWDGDDPYLVVAADRGTATYSDVANGIAAEFGFWLGDAFASGGSRGYDHKGLGITARGAWVAVHRHLRDLGIDTQRDPFTVVGIGDMSGDVFGNGMLQSRTLRLVAAFDHRHIFIDPDPDPERSFVERQRLFRLARSSWQDYDRDAISEGGGVWPRASKQISLAPKVRDALRLASEVVTPPDLIRAILRAPVDRLFVGGIGTFVKDSRESNEDIGDRANAEIRIDANELRARVVGEGANLAFTQRARIQYARRGGRINTDFIDNVAGVDISDHEVNLKILLRRAIERGEIGMEERDRLLQMVTEDVVAECLRDVDLQTRILSREVLRSATDLDAFETLLRELEAAEAVDRDVEALPSTSEIESRRAAGAGFTRPELAVLLAATKRDLANVLVRSGLPDQAALRGALVAYVPPLLAERFGHLLDGHRLRRELIAAVVANDVVNRMGSTFVHRLERETGADAVGVVGAYWVARTVADSEWYWSILEELGDAVDADLQRGLEEDVAGLLESLTREYARHHQGTDDLAAVIARDRPVFEQLEIALTGDTPAAGTQARAERLVAAGVDPTVAERLAALQDLAITPDVATVARSTGRPTSGVAAAFLLVGAALGLDRLRVQIEAVTPSNEWSGLELRGLLDDLRSLQQGAVQQALVRTPGEDELTAARAFVTERQSGLEHAARLARRAAEVDPEARLDALAVAVRALRVAVSAT